MRIRTKLWCKPSEIFDAWITFQMSNRRSFRSETLWWSQKTSMCNCCIAAKSSSLEWMQYRYRNFANKTWINNLSKCSFVKRSLFERTKSQFLFPGWVNKLFCTSKMLLLSAISFGVKGLPITNDFWRRWHPHLYDICHSSAKYLSDQQYHNCKTSKPTFTFLWLPKWYSHVSRNNPHFKQCI